MTRRNDSSRKEASADCVLPESECSEDDANREEGLLECPICWESFNIVENVPYVLWCGHTMCKNCVLGLQLAVVKLTTASLRIPFCVFCPWCSLLTLRVVRDGNLRFPRKNYFLLWMIESMNGERVKSPPAFHQERHHALLPPQSNPYNNAYDPDSSPGDLSAFAWLQASLRKTLLFIFHLTAKFPLVFIFLLVVVYAVPTSAIILILYVAITVLFAVPSLLILYFAYPILDWIVRELFG